MKSRLAVFTGNRGEFGILFPFIFELHNLFKIDLFVSGAHVLYPWNTINEIREKLKKHEMEIAIQKISLNSKKNIYQRSLAVIYNKMLSLLDPVKEKYLCAIVLGDRIETLGFSLAAFFSKVPLVHIGAGDVNNNPYFDTNVRHCITKVSHIFLTLNRKAKNVLIGMGEEEWRIKYIGMLSYDYDRLGLLPSVFELENTLKIRENGFSCICTYHPSHLKSDEENLNDFKTVYKAINHSQDIKKIIITYPNNDPGSKLMIEYLDHLKNRMINNQRFSFISNLGTETYLAIQKYFKTIIVGNSSSGLLETPFYCTPTINIGDRQNERLRSSNVMEVPIKEKIISDQLQYCISNYEKLKSYYESDRFYFGDGRAALKAYNTIKSLMKFEKGVILNKKFVIRKHRFENNSNSISS